MIIERKLQDILNRTASRADRTVVWLFPERPVLAAFTTQGPLRCDLDKPATPSQLLQTIKEMGLVTGMLDRAYTHALRLGAARDIAHAPTIAQHGCCQVTETV